MSPGVEQGYLVLADVSGYTGFLAGTELEHATGILAELLEETLGGLSPPFELVEVEGDAVFVHGPGSAVGRGDELLDVIEQTYAGFRKRRDVMAARTTCKCGACSRIDSLDLKFITHFGDYALQPVAGRSKPVGNDVNLIHRLLKNGIEAETGCRAYALFTDSALTRLGFDDESMHRRTESYEHLGDVGVSSLDLDERHRWRTGPEPATPAESLWQASLDLPLPPERVWEWLNDPAKRSRWLGGRTVEVELPVSGEMGEGAVFHCYHGDSVIDHRVVDWHPYSAFSEEVRPRPGFRALLSWRLAPDGGGTRLQLDIGLSGPLPRAVRRRLCRVFAEREVRPDLERLERAIAGAVA